LRQDGLKHLAHILSRHLCSPLNLQHSRVLPAKSPGRSRTCGRLAVKGQQEHDQS
jgi:hypothetical protein